MIGTAGRDAAEDLAFDDIIIAAGAAGWRQASAWGDASARVRCRSLGREELLPGTATILFAENVVAIILGDAQSGATA